MAQQSTVKPITQQELDIFGVSLMMVARVGEKTFSASVSPMDFDVFKSEIYRDRLYAGLVKRIEYDLEKSVGSGGGWLTPKPT